MAFGVGGAGVWQTRGIGRSLGVQPGGRHAVEAPAGPSVPSAGRRPRAVLVDVYGSMLRLSPLRRRFTDVGRPEHEYDLFLALALRDAMGLALTGTPAAFEDVLRDAVHAATQHKLAAEAVEHVLCGLRALPAHADAEPALTVFARSRIPAWAVGQGSGERISGALDAEGLRSFLRGTVATDDLGIVVPHRDAYLLACAAARIDPATTAFVSVHPYLVHGAMEAGLVGALALRDGARAPQTMPPAHVCGATLVEAAEKLLALPA
jgi:2-haloacid dehalogenase